MAQEEQIEKRFPYRPAAATYGEREEERPSRVHEVKYGEAPSEVAASCVAKQQQRPGGPGAWRPSVADDKPATQSRDAPQATIGDVLEQVGVFSGSETIVEKDARAIQNAEYLATGRSSDTRGGPAAGARSAVDEAAYTGDKPTFCEVLQDVKNRMASDKVVTEQDAESVSDVESRADPHGEIEPGHVAAAMSEAAAYNKSLEEAEAAAYNNSLQE